MGEGPIEWDRDSQSLLGEKERKSVLMHPSKENQSRQYRCMRSRGRLLYRIIIILLFMECEESRKN